MKTPLITGANKGIGYEVARQLAAKGFHVLLAARNSAAGSNAAQTLAEGGASATFIPLDVSDSKSVADAVRHVVGVVDHLDVLVNNAAIIVDGDSAILEVEMD